MRETTILRAQPSGWWYHDVRNYGQDTDGSWVGPYSSYEAAEKAAKMLCPDHQEKIEIRRYECWEKRIVGQPPLPPLDEE